MPDGLTHVAAAYLGAHNYLTKGRLTLFLAGSLLPDILLRGGRLLFVGRSDHNFLELYLTPLHSPFAALFICFAIAQLFHSQIRKSAFLLLYAGFLSHFILDFLQRTIEGTGLTLRIIGGYHWLFPFSWIDGQFGLMWAEDTPYILIVLLPIVSWLWLRQRKQKKR